MKIYSIARADLGLVRVFFFMRLKLGEYHFFVSVNAIFEPVTIARILAPPGGQDTVAIDQGELNRHEEMIFTKLYDNLEVRSPVSLAHFLCPVLSYAP